MPFYVAGVLSEAEYAAVKAHLLMWGRVTEAAMRGKVATRASYCDILSMCASRAGGNVPVLGRCEVPLFVSSGT